jgi:bifunctional UDP-N-acetylglucosamine pyrophosphorylase/glucosamine-1-phosphate N-acetyltransferase
VVKRLCIERHTGKTMSLAVIILAAGKGTRMRSALPKVLHRLSGTPMVAHVVAAARALAPESISIVYGHGGEAVRAALPDDDLKWVQQTEQLGTGHAVNQAMPDLHEDRVMILYGDVPLIQPDTLRRCLSQVDDNSLCLITLNMDDPSGYGRILRDDTGNVCRIVEQKDASMEQLCITEINTGILACPRAFLARVLPTLSNNNAQGEYYLTDVIALAAGQKLVVNSVQPTHKWEVDGINDRVQLARLERIHQRLLAERLMRDGVSLRDPARLDVRGQVESGQDVSIDINVVLEGQVVLGEGVSIGPNCVIRDAVIGAGSVIHANSVIDTAEIGENCTVGPFARLRPGATLACDVHVGNFVEIKKTTLGEGSKVNHLTYLGDAVVGRGVNVGAGTITCNYDGINKWPTRIGDGAFIGSNTSLVAPVTIGRNATIGAGSVITHDVNADQLGVARGHQRNLDGWQRPLKQKQPQKKSRKEKD